MRSIGGYLELQLSKGEEFYPSLLKLNTGRNAFEYILRVRRYQLVHVPYYTCEVMLEPLRRLGISFQYYTIDEHMDPVLDFEVGPTECLLYTNYFGLKQETVIRLSTQFKNLIIDNSQAFFSPPQEGVDTFYSCRKFFGVPDGAYLQMDSPIRLKLEKDVSFERFSHLIKSIDLGIESGYEDFINNNVQLSNNPVRRMSALSQKILSGIDYKTCRYRRNSNFMYLHDFLEAYNDYAFDASVVNGPMIYPLLSSSPNLRDKLLDKQIYVASYWPNVLEWTTKMMYEHYLTSHLIALPIDHRYTHADMKRILNILKTTL
ncbi:hypothetical protein [Pedobacter steynii]|uniref:DegT/DnrJ/EryC1/StrS aminotransferase family protein n=1 Tax=Pedobacter steynii TaxID=430522 RepID=A0A1D7QB46_9SPHI|nr:hypothetical protein [Pedobacter steynii]AOM75916.1 hypothetical protein BFS30_01255 [Pedobacter steynii]